MKPGGAASGRHPLVDALIGGRDGHERVGDEPYPAAFGLKPHLVDSFKLSIDPQFIEKVRDVVGLYLNPPVRHEAPTDRVG